MYLIYFIIFVPLCNSAKILCVFPAPFHSHQYVFRPLTFELAKRGHELVIITTHPAFKHASLKNVREIDVHDISYECISKYSIKTGKIDDLYNQMDRMFDMCNELIESQIKTVEVQELINDKSQHFDLILIEAVTRPALIFSHIFKAPVITISSLGTMDIFTKYLEGPKHPILYPDNLHQRLINNKLTVWERAKKVYNHYLFVQLLSNKEAQENEMLKKNFGNDVPPLSELKKNVKLLMMNVHHLWEDNRPVPPNVVYLGGLHMEYNDTKKLPTELKSYLDSSTHGVIYMSLGTLVVPSVLENIDIVIQAFSKLPYDILLKWDNDYLPDCPSNVRITKWAPQKQLLHHPKIKLFIMQGGLQSTDEAILAGVPLLGVPVFGDQWYNVERYVHLKIGLRIDMESVTEDKMLNAIRTLIDDQSYKRNIGALRSLLYDRPQRSLDRAVWWTEYILRNGRSQYHLKAPAAHMSLWEYLDMELILVSALCSISFLLAVVFVVYKVVRAIPNIKNVCYKFILPRNKQE